MRNNAPCGEFTPDWTCLLVMITTPRRILGITRPSTHLLEQCSSWFFPNAGPVQSGFSTICRLHSTHESDKAPNFLDDITLLAPKTRHEKEGGTYKTIPENSGIHRFIGEHAVDLNRVLHLLKHAGVTVSAKKRQLCSLQIVVMGRRGTYEGRQADVTMMNGLTRFWDVEFGWLDLIGWILESGGQVRVLAAGDSEGNDEDVTVGKKGGEDGYDGDLS
ncbi:hypothetical protein AX17_005081 [Amanita inopinata Kibby_2008]|nr:hypothetical protein AX17_005081 [Amanita inopinata Kibby_2008]